MRDPSEAVVSRLAPSHAHEVAALHELAFPGAFLTGLGQPLLRAFYRDLGRWPDTVGSVAHLDGRLVGFTAGTYATRPVVRRFVRHHPGLTVASVVAGAARGPEMRRMLLVRVRRALRGNQPAVETSQAAPTAPGAPVPARLLSIALTPDARGRGVAERLVDHHRRSLAAAGIDRVGLSVRRDNPRAIAFYRRSRWRIERETDDAIYLWRPTTGD